MPPEHPAYPDLDRDILENALSLVREPVLVLDDDRRVTFTNRAFHDTFGLRGEALLGRRVNELADGRWDIPSLRQLLDDVLAEEDERRHHEIDHEFPIVGRRVLLVNARRVPAGDGKDHRVVLTMTDVTALRESQRHLRELDDMLQERGLGRRAELVEGHRILRESNEALDSFSYVVGHDLKEPVRAMEIHLGVLLEDHVDALPDDVRRHIESVRAANQRLGGLVGSLLDFSRAARIDPANLQPLSLNAALRSEDAQTRFQDLLEARGARLELPEDDHVVYATTPAVGVILGNLILNAVQHNTAPEPVVRVRAEPAKDGRRIEVVVEDNGPGYPPDVVAGFERVDVTGRGFGLAVTKRAVERLGGVMWLGRSAEGGAAAHVLLPTPPTSVEGMPWRSRVHVHDHAACVYGSHADLRRALVHFVHQGVETKELTIFVHSFATDDEAWQLIEEARADAPQLRKAQIVVVGLYRDVFQGESPHIDYDHVLRIVQANVDAAETRGLDGVRIFVDASRIYLDEDRADEWFAFEEWLGRRLQAQVGLVCAYRRSDVAKPDLLSRMIRTHAYRFDAPGAIPASDAA